MAFLGGRPSGRGDLRHTELDAVETEVEARQHHLAQTEPRAECGEETDGGDSEQVDE